MIKIDRLEEIRQELLDKLDKAKYQDARSMIYMLSLLFPEDEEGDKNTN